MVRLRKNSFDHVAFSICCRRKLIEACWPETAVKLTPPRPFEAVAPGAAAKDRSWPILPILPIVLDGMMGPAGAAAVARAVGLPSMWSMVSLASHL
jgi:hypothetical protein